MMCEYIDVKYINLCSSILEKFKQKTSSLWNFRCPVCGDSQKNKNKSRGFIYEKKNKYFYRCHNCEFGTSFSKFLEKINPSLHREYVTEQYKEKRIVKSVDSVPKFSFVPEFNNVLKGLQEGTLAAEPQDDTKASVTRLIDRSDGEIDWASPAERIDRMIRAYDPWPGTFTKWNGKGLKVLDAQISSVSASVAAAGAGVVVIDQGRVNVGTGSASIELKKVQLEGRQAIAATDFLMGQPDFDGATLGT